VKRPASLNVIDGTVSKIAVTSSLSHRKQKIEAAINKKALKD
jgi:hypothetical protein